MVWEVPDRPRLVVVDQAYAPAAGEQNACRRAGQGEKKKKKPI